MATFVTHDMVPSGGGGGLAVTGETVDLPTSSGGSSPGPHAIVKQKTISVPTSAAAVFLQLPAPASADSYVDYEVKDGKMDAGTNTITVTAASGLIDGETSYEIISDGAAVKFFTDGTDWFVA